MSYITDSKNKYIDVFPDGWIESLNWDEGAEQCLGKGLFKINQFASEFFVLLSKSVLCGEYIKNDNIEDVIDIFETYLGAESNPSTEQDEKYTLYKAYGSLNANIHNVLCHYRGLVALVVNKIKIINENGILFSAFSSKSIEFKNSSDKYFRHFVDFVIDIARSDHFFYTEANDKIINHLILIREELSIEKKVDNLPVQFIYNVLYDKCSFLLKKNWRDQSSITYSLDFKTNSLSETEIQIENFKDLDKKWNFINRKYSSQYASDINKWELDQYRGVFDLSHFILLMKLYQKDNKSLHQANNLLNQFDNFYQKEIKEDLNIFDRYALMTIENYLFNCNLSIAIASNKYSFQQLEKDVEAVKNLQAKTKILNFYPFRKFSEYLSKQISEDLKKDDSDTEVISEKIGFLEELIECYESCVKWCTNSKFYPFQLRFDECLIDYKDEKGDLFRIFMPSSFNKPIDYGILTDEFNKLKSKIVFYNGQIDIQRKIRRETAELLEIKDRISSSEKRSIEILGVFTAVIAFLFTGINLFSQQTGGLKLLDALKSITAFGVVLLLFSSSIYFITVKRQPSFSDYLKHPRFIFFTFVSLIYLCFLVLLVLSNFYITPI